MSDGIPEREQEAEAKPTSPWPFVGLLAIAFLPATILAVVLYFMLRKGRQRLSVIGGLATLLAGIGAAIALTTDAWPQALTAFQGLLSMNWEAWQGLIPFAIALNLALGALGGFVLAGLEVHQMKTNPHRLQLRGNWMYGFKYRRTPLQVFRRKKAIEGLKQGRWARDDKAPLGLDEQVDAVVQRFDQEAVTHTLISGAAGSGKTVTLLSLIHADIESGKPAFVIDFKRSPEVAAKLAAWAVENDAEFFHFVNGEPEDYDVKDSPGQSFYDPLRSGSATAKADMVLGMREYDTASAVYRSNMQQLLQVVFGMLAVADRAKAPSITWDAGGIQQLATAVSGDNLAELAQACEGTSAHAGALALAEEAKRKGSALRHAVEELQGQLRTIVASEYGRWLRQDANGSNIDIFKLSTAERKVVLFSLNSDSEPEFARYVGSMILADFTALSAQRRNAAADNQVNVYVDEFQAVPPTAVTSLLEKSRESRMAMTLAQQSFEQIISASQTNGEAYLLSILDTCSNFIVHNGMTEDSATRLSKILGKHWVTVYRQTNQNESFFLSLNFKNRRQQTVSTSEEERWVFEPRHFMKLSSPSANNGYKATAVVVNKTSADPRFRNREGALARVVWMIPNQEVVASYYKPSMRSRAPRPPALTPMPIEVDSAPIAVQKESFERHEQHEAPRRPVVPAEAADGAASTSTQRSFLIYRSAPDDLTEATEPHPDEMVLPDL